MKNILQTSERRHFDRLVEETGETYYGNLRPIAKVRFRRKAKAIIDLLANIKNPKILEIGCGTGILSRHLLEINPHLEITGVDISPRAIATARKTLKNYPQVNLEVRDVLKLPYKKRSFDAVVGNSILHHVPVESLLREIKQVLKPQGFIWFCEPNILNPQIAFEKNVPVFKSLFQDSKNERGLSRWGIKSDLQKLGFEDVEVKPYEFLHPLIPGRLLRVVVPLLIFLEKTPFINEFAGTLQITGRLTK